MQTVALETLCISALVLLDIRTSGQESMQFPSNVFTNLELDEQQGSICSSVTHDTNSQQQCHNGVSTAGAWSRCSVKQVLQHCYTFCFKARQTNRNMYRKQHSNAHGRASCSCIGGEGGSHAGTCVQQ